MYNILFSHNKLERDYYFLIEYSDIQKCYANCTGSHFYIQLTQKKKAQKNLVSSLYHAIAKFVGYILVLDLGYSQR